MSAAIASIACGVGSTSPQSIEPVYDPSSGRLTELRYDADGDGRRETVSYMDGGHVFRIEIDEDGDSRPDRWEHYDAAGRLERVGFSRARNGKADVWRVVGPAATGRTIELSHASPGRVDRWEHYNETTLAAAEEDTDHDGRVDKWETYEGGRLVSVAFDGSRRGSPDRRLVYRLDGEVRVDVLSDSGTVGPTLAHE